MSPQRRWRPVAYVAPTALIFLLLTGCGTADDPQSVAAAPAQESAVTISPAPLTAAPTRTLTETPTKQIRPDAPLRSTGSSGSGPPVRLQVPRVGIDSALTRLGLTADGSMAVPVSAARAGWYTGGPAPGQVGPAVVAGHVDSHTGPGVFYRLAELRSGDVIVVRRAAGRAVRFTVTGSRRVAKSAFPTNEVYGATPFAELRLITCGGAFDAAAGHYRDNVVVFARQLD